MKKALVVIDVQNDYFPEGAFPLWNAEQALAANLKAIESAKQQDIPVILVQHVADASAPFFRPGTQGVEIHSQILEAAPDAPVVVKHQADSFLETELKAILDRLEVQELILSGMMTHNCVTHTALSPQVDSYNAKVLSPGTTTVSEVIHLLALHALSARIEFVEQV